MRRINNIRRWLGTDGMLHVLCSIVLVVTTGILFPVWISALTTLIVGVTKELAWDKWLNRGSATWHDFACDIIGTAIGASLLVALQ